MQYTHQYYYHRGKLVTRTVLHILLVVVLVALAVFCFMRWDLSFMFTEWQGYVILVPYFLITLGVILTIFNNFRKLSMTARGIPALAVDDEHFVFMDKSGLATVVHFEDCDRVRFKSTYSRICGKQLKLSIKYHSKADPLVTTSVELDLTELDQSQFTIEKQLKKVYHKYKKEHESSST